MTAAPLHLAGEALLLDPSGVLVWPRGGLMAVADLHLEKASAAARRGALLPPWDSRITLENLARAVGRYRPRILVAVGDSFHDDGGPSRLGRHERARLARIADGRRLVWVAGNHDPAPPRRHPLLADRSHADPARTDPSLIDRTDTDPVPGEAAREYAAGPFLFRHQGGGASDVADAAEICGHHHPKASVATRGGGISRPCFVACATGRRLMLPAFGAYTGGLDVTHPAIRTLFPRGGRVFLTGAERVFAFALGASHAGA